MTPSELDTRLRDLLKTHASATGNACCIECMGCERCVRSTFCHDSKRLVRCHYCADCADCADSAHCRSCTGLSSCTHCIESRGCLGSAYLARCVDLVGCSYCFGCVGLVEVDFHILNERYERSEYFALTSTLLREKKL